uniref:NADH-ubiquinone oxidoreductase chain 6 n=1 Tax=Callosobruchus maculatus TaxID=64391 RepID=A0A343KPT5_CALMS|nr:NADH dehydrogenase subunit 6 [Callosobruchus maculatus]ATL15446.1 NADH dehydrogenase subunit 6 [Callosobruchus maculatus]ATL15459.1 NADH dehydrogenase subunit 6 [Callosobruchus maculatus]ATL15472.1 NADH dehydrogenase subunit 6 [Callosobruchus maculatus]
MYTLILSFMMIMSSMFMLLNHPLSMGLILLIQTTLTTLIMGINNLNYWYSYILFLIMIGGMLILFIYMTSIASNEKFKFSTNLFILFNIQLMISLTMLILDQYFVNMTFFKTNLFKQDLLMNYQFSMNKYFNYPSNWILYMMIIYLLITLIMVVKITNMNQSGPLRQMN